MTGDERPVKGAWWTAMQADALAAGTRALLETGLGDSATVLITGTEETSVTHHAGDARPDTLWPIASITKSMTAVLALQLVDEGLLELDGPASRFLPWGQIRTAYEPISLRHLLTNSSGLVGPGPTVGPAPWFDLVLMRETEAGFAPGEHMHYSNLGYRLVGLMLEAVTGSSFATLLQERIFDRLGMSGSTPITVTASRARMLTGLIPRYDDRPWRKEHGHSAAPWFETSDADGCACCTPEDLAIYLRALARGDERILSPEAGALIATAAVDVEGGTVPHGYGYGLVILDRTFGHNGGDLGYSAAMWMGEDGVGAVAFLNGFTGAYDLARAALAVAHGEEPPRPSVSAPPPAHDDGSGCPEFRSYVGRYRSYNPWMTSFQIVAVDGSLWLAADAAEGSLREPLTPLGDRTFRAGRQTWSPERIRFEEPVAGSAPVAVYSGMRYYRALIPSSPTA